MVGGRRKDGGKEGARVVGMWLEGGANVRSEEHTSVLQSRRNVVCRLLLAKKKPIACLTLTFFGISLVP